jgi:hypothetical protein
VNVFFCISSHCMILVGISSCRLSLVNIEVFRIISITLDGFHTWVRLHLICEIQNTVEVIEQILCISHSNTLSINQSCKL